MRTLVEIFVIGALIYFGWEKPFKESVDQVRSKLTGKPTEVAPIPAAPTPTPAPRIVPGCGTRIIGRSLIDRHMIKRSRKQGTKTLPAEVTGSTLRASATTTSKGSENFYSFTTSICLPITWPVKPSIATCTQ